MGFVSHNSRYTSARKSTISIEKTNGFGLRAFGNKSLSPIYSCPAYVSATFIATFLLPKELSLYQRFLGNDEGYDSNYIICGLFLYNSVLFAKMDEDNN